MSSTVVQIFIAEQATPVSLTITIPWQPATPMVTAGVWNTLVTVVTLPSVMALALAGNSASTMQQVTSLLAYSLFTFFPHPAIHASLVAVMVTGIVANKVIPWSAKLVAHYSIVIFITFDSNFHIKVGNMALQN